MFQPFGSEPLRAAGIPTYGPNVGAGTDIGSTISQGASDFGNQFSSAVKNPIDFARHVGEGDALAGGAKIGMYAASPFVEDMMKPQTFAYTDPEKGKYKGPQGQLNLSDKFDTGLRLVAEGGYIDGYAMGGTVQSGGIRDLYGTPDNPPTMSSGLGGFGLGRLNDLAGEQAMTQAQTLGYADGGDVGMNLDQLPSLNINTGEQIPTMSINLGNSRFNRNFGIDDTMQSRILNSLPSNNMQSRIMNYGISPIQAYEKGGYLNGNGDGMSDSIPATIEGKQPARLADGEFVVPADVVSHLGNGSTKAGSKRLYAMLDKVRKARTGHTKQGKKIKPEKYMPA
jgi:hypothetical protein